MARWLWGFFYFCLELAQKSGVRKRIVFCEGNWLRWRFITGGWMIKRVNISLSEAGRRVFAAAPRLVGITLMVMRLFGKFFAVIFGLCGAVIGMSCRL